MLDGVEPISLDTIELIQDIATMMEDTNNSIQERLPKIYSKDLVEILFYHPYTKIDFLIDGLGLTRQTASKYLKELEVLGIVESIKIKNSTFYVNISLFNRLKKGI